jgi:UDP-MurNAc hydroxylase
MRITMVGHASVLVEAGAVGLLSDPWYVGDAFNESWMLHPAPQPPADLFERVTHLWISHEHPDHMSIPTLRAIPEQQRARITLLYQRHWSDAVASWLGRMGFARMVELRHGEVAGLGGGVQARLFQVRHEDAALAVHHGGTTVFNLNDGKPSTATLGRLRRRIGPIEVLLGQFSPAGWPGNPEESERLEAASGAALDQLVRQADVLRPRHVVPFASFVRFGHEENAFMNGAINRMDRVVAALDGRAVVLGPGDQWRLGAPFQGSAAAVDRFVDAVDRIPDLPLKRHDPVPYEEVAASAEAHVEALRGSYHRPVLDRVGQVHFQLTDLGRSLTLDLPGGRVVDGGAGEAPGRVELSSQAAWYTFHHRWGVPTLLISGRFRLPAGEAAFRRYKVLGSAWSAGFHTCGLPAALTRGRGRDLLTHRWRDLRDLVPGGS